MARQFSGQYLVDECKVSSELVEAIINSEINGRFKQRIAFGKQSIDIAKEELAGTDYSDEDLKKSKVAIETNVKRDVAKINNITKPDGELVDGWVYLAIEYFNKYTKYVPSVQNKRVSSNVPEVHKSVSNEGLFKLMEASNNIVDRMNKLEEENRQLKNILSQLCKSVQSLTSIVETNNSNTTKLLETSNTVNKQDTFSNQVIELVFINPINNQFIKIRVDKKLMSHKPTKNEAESAVKNIEDRFKKYVASKKSEYDGMTYEQIREKYGLVNAELIAAEDTNVVFQRYPLVVLEQIVGTIE